MSPTSLCLVFPLHRLSLLIAAGLAAGHIIKALTPPFQRFQRPNGRTMSVVVIGSGVSGLEASAQLTRAGIPVTLIEARPRIGGRTFTHKTKGGGSYDLGASWLHDTLKNDFFDFALDHNVKTYFNDNGVIYVGPQGQLDAKETHPQAANEIFNAMEIAYHKTGAPDISLKEFCQKFAEKRRPFSDANRKVAPQIARVLELYHGLEWEKISAHYGGLDHAGRDAFVVDNYDTILKHLTSRIDKKLFKVVLDCPVSTIDSTNSSEIVTKCRNGSVYRSKYVICTVPLGVLKANAIEFVPSLPKKLQHAIDTMDFAALGKVIFEFDSVFWGEDWDRAMAVADPNKQDEESRRRFDPWTYPVYLVNSYLMTGRPSLITLTAPPLTQYLEANPSEAVRYYRPILESIRVDKSKPLPNIKEVIVTSWTQDEFARGSYSAFGVGVDPMSIFSAFEEGSGPLRFAGEHTSSVGTSCTHGAFASGQREAAWILSKEKSNSML